MLHRPNKRSGFTLVELLVVITIIVVLLALLTPALDSAITQAELAACGATIVTGGITYASANRRLYPSRGPHDWDALQVRLVDDNWGVAVFDIPKLMSAYVGMSQFLDPLGGGVDLNAGSQRTGTKSGPPTLYSNYLVYFDWGHPNSNLRSARKLGDRLIFNAPAPENETRVFDILISDLDSRRARPDGVWDADVYSSHPDKAGKLTQLIVEDKDNPFVKDTPLPIGKVTTSWWWGHSPPLPMDAMRGLVDYNYGHDDNSVSRLTNVEIDDPRCRKIVLTAIGEYINDRRAQLPGQVR
jgi:prepilin-type N-terminal cleavage/methylation domain-containing protein